MDRLIRLARLWSWLPAFRACAETQNLHRAAELLHVSPSALSRAVHLLEEDVGRPLFVRTGRNVQLNAAGGELLGALREVMRRLDDCVSRVEGAPSPSALHVSGFGEITRCLVVPALGAIREQLPSVIVHVHSCAPADVPALLLSGQLDVAVARQPVATPQLLSVPLGRLPAGVYCGRGHPLFGATAADEGAVLAHPFVAPVDDGGAGFSDGWPALTPRRVGMRSGDAATALEICARGLLLAALPDCVAEGARRSGELRRLPVELVPPTTLYALRREPLEGVSSSDVVVAALRAQADRLSSRSA
jgi:DNA-binding transcriptional LysR family regulator